MASEAKLTAREFLDGIFEQIRPHADNPEEFASEWRRITGDLDKQVEYIMKLEEKDDHAAQWESMRQRDGLSRQLILLVRTQLANSYLFDDLRLQESQGCSVLSDYAAILNDPKLERRRGDVWSGHNRDGIHWTCHETCTMPEPPEKKLDFRGSERSGWPYCGCMDHALSSLICKVWGFSGFTDTKPDCPKKGWLPSSGFSTAWWKDSSMYLAVLLCFGVNILNDQGFLDKIGASLVETDTPQQNLKSALEARAAGDIRAALWERMQEII